MAKMWNIRCPYPCDKCHIACQGLQCEAWRDWFCWKWRDATERLRKRAGE